MRSTAEQLLLGRLTVFEAAPRWRRRRPSATESAGAGLEAGGLAARQELAAAHGFRPDAEPRFAMLDTVREFAAERAAERGGPRRARAAARALLPEYCERAAEQAARTDRREWLDRLAQERGNIRLAFERLLRAGATEEALRVAIAFARALPWDAHAHEVRGWLAQALARSARAYGAPRGRPYWDGVLALSQGLLRRCREATARRHWRRRAKPASRPSRPPR